MIEGRKQFLKGNLNDLHDLTRIRTDLKITPGHGQSGPHFKITDEQVSGR
jgi:hypothetical protein